MENQNLNILDEVNKGATMGMDAIDFLVPKVQDGNFKKVLDVEYNKYKDISRRANNLYENLCFEIYEGSRKIFIIFNSDGTIDKEISSDDHDIPWISRKARNGQIIASFSKLRSFTS